MANSIPAMNTDTIHAAMATWAAKDLPARLHATQVAKLLNCTPDDVTVLASAGRLRALGKPRPNSVKFFSAIELFTLLADRDWLDEATKTIGQYWRRKNERRSRWRLRNRAEGQGDGACPPVRKASTKPSTESSTSELKVWPERGLGDGQRLISESACGPEKTAQNCACN